MTRMSLARAGAFVLTAVLAAMPGAAQERPRSAQGASPDPATVTVSGCLWREADLPDMRPSLTERAGIGEDYILTAATQPEGEGDRGRTDERGSAAETKTPGGTAATAIRMYRVTGLEDQQLRPRVGTRVRVTGRLENVPGQGRGNLGSSTKATGTTSGQTSSGTPGTNDRGSADRGLTLNENLPEIDATAIAAATGAACRAPDRR